MARARRHHRGGEAPPVPHRVRTFLSCTARLPVDVVAAFHERFGAPICQHYGSSEAGAVATHDPARVLDHPDSVGRPMHGVDVQIRVGLNMQAPWAWP